jgi:hypothetical protein
MSYRKQDFRPDEKWKTDACAVALMLVIGIAIAFAHSPAKECRALRQDEVETLAVGGIRKAKLNLKSLPKGDCVAIAATKK